ncbi:hypothetical protein UJ101_01390 [Flavobacteriaceae bacterium UJ101]|nr:hypothetical protein UJ101_01390 [Flavobacteriaceae bacterium UJ101]
MKLENLNVQELSADEQVNTEGGIFGPLLFGAAGLASAYLVAAYLSHDEHR